MTGQDIAAALPALASGNTAVITGAASGIGLAAASRYARLGMNVVLADLPGQRLDEALATVSSLGQGKALAVPCNVSKREALQALASETLAAFGTPSVLMNNAGVGFNPGAPWQNVEQWREMIDINFWGAVYGVEAFAESMIAAGAPALIINTGSKQGITTPPGNLAYNVSKSALKTYSEGLQHALRNLPGAQVSAHLLIPGFTFTGITGQPEKPAGAWSAEQVIDFMLNSLARGDFYILCPDNEVTRDIDEKRMAWAIGDIVSNRPPLSRWHPDHGADFAEYMKE